MSIGEIFGFVILACAIAGLYILRRKIRRFIGSQTRSPAFQYLKRDIRAIVGLAIIVLILVMVIFADFIAPHPYKSGPVEDQKKSPSWEYPFGTDSRARCVFSGVLYGSRWTLVLGLLLVAVVTTIGVTLGLIAGYYGGKVDEIIMRIADVALSFPGLVLAIFLVGIFGGGPIKLIFALAVVGWVGFARVTRGETLKIKAEVYVEGAKAIGEKDRNIILHYVLPNAISPIIVLMTMTFAASLLIITAMNFLGLGLSPGEPAWGMMINHGADYLREAPWASIFPGVAIMITVLAFNFLGDALRDAFDPRLRD